MVWDVNYVVKFVFEEFIYIIIKCFYERVDSVVIFWGFPGWFRFDIRNIWGCTIVFVRFILVFQFKNIFQFYFPIKVFYVGFNLFFFCYNILALDKNSIFFNTLNCVFVNECSERLITFPSGSSLYRAALEIVFCRLAVFP